MPASWIHATATLRTAGLDAYIRQLADGPDRASARAARDLAETWRGLVHRITGAYAASIGIMTHTESEFAERAAAAQALNPDAGIIPEPPRPQRKGAARVFAAVDYAVWEEIGTRRRPGHPAFIRAVELTRARLAAYYRAELAA